MKFYLIPLGNQRTKDIKPKVRGFILTIVILLQLTCSSQDQTLPIQTIDFLPKTKIVTSSSLKYSSGIRSIFEDSKGNIWLGSLKEGVCLFNGSTFSYFTVENGLSNNQVLTIQEDRNGVIWFSTQNGVSSFDEGQMTNQTPNIVANAEHSWSKTEEDLWFDAGVKEGVYRYNGQQLDYLAFPKPKVINPNNLYAVTSLSKGKDNMLWIGTYAGVFGYNGRDFTIINDETLGLNIYTAPLHIRSLLEDSKGRLWIGNNGIGVLLKEGDTTINFSEKHNLIHPSSSRKGDPSLPGTLEHVFTIAEDSNGNIWFGDRDTGIWKYDGKTMVNYTSVDGQKNDFPLSIYTDKNGALWFGMADGNVYKFDGETFEKQS
ncbi:MAG: two-component regulator propeller domain-containing protein [Bacteroidota bacterium]